MRALFWVVLAVAILGQVLPARADIFPRASAPAGSVIARKSGEEVRFIDVSGWRGVDIRQDLLAGDVLRTNAIGHLAILFSDRTQVRLGRNTTLLVKEIGAASDTVFGLTSGTIWARAERGGVGLTVETPAAAAAIRGTDWTMTVEADGKTSLIVLEGLVELANEYGAVSVAGGEAAVAAIGQAPTKVLIVDPEDREQMLFYLSLRSAFTWMPASPLPGTELRRERARVLTIPAEARNAGDWTAYAEAALAHDGQEAAHDAVARARALRPTTAQQARLDLVGALVAGSRQNYEDAARLFAHAAPRLDPQRRAIAAYGGYYARALADPNHAETPPSLADTGPYAAMAEAFTTGFLVDIAAAVAVLKRAEARFPEDPTLPAFRAKFALLLDDREQVREALDRALSLDPADPDALAARATYRQDIESDLDGALADFTRAAEIMPGSTDIWNGIGLVQMERGAYREAEAALRHAIALDPNDPAARANLAILLLDQDRVDEAKGEIDTALRLDPEFHVALVARGRYLLQAGERDKALQDLLAGSTANPAYAQALLLLGAAYYENREREAAGQAIENADRLDPNDPVTSSFRAAIAIDDYDAEAAIDSAQEALRRSRARGGDYAPVSANQDAGSTLNEAFRLQGLDAWGRYYGDIVFDPFAGASFVDQAISGSPDPFAENIYWGGDPADPSLNTGTFSSLFQGLMLSPETLSGSSRGANLVRKPFLEATLGGGFIHTDNDWHKTGEAEIQAYADAPVPWSLYGRLQAQKTEEFRESITPGSPVTYTGFGLELEDLNGTAWLTARPTPHDRVASYIDVRSSDTALADAIILLNDPLLVFDAIAYDRTVDSDAVRAGLGWSHTFGHRNVANAAVFFSGLSQASHEEGVLFVTPFPLGLQTIDASLDQKSYVGAVSHAIGMGDVDLRYGVEGSFLKQSVSRVTTLLPLIPVPPVVDIVTRDAELGFGRAYVDAIYDITPGLKAEGAIFATHLGGPLGRTELDPRAGLAWSPIAGHWLRAAYIHETSTVLETTLAPIGILGLQSNQLPLDIGGVSRTVAARWDAEWTDRLFASLDYQHQEFDDLALQIPAGITTIDIAKGRIDRVAATANLRLGHGLGAFATVAFADSEDRDPLSPGFGGPLPFVPETAARVGLTWVNPANVKLTLAGTYVGERAGNAFGDRLDDYWTADAFLTWEPLDKRFALELAGYNLLDDDFEVAPGVPGWGRTIVGTFKVRF